MTRWLLLIVLFFILTQVIKLSRQLWQVIRRSRGLRTKNQEGVGSLSKTPHQLFLLLALIQSACFIIDWLMGGFEERDLYLALIMVGLPLYLYLYLDCDDR